MFLKELYVEGFKSIANKTKVDLINNVNVIMGPNGSGKSNFFECIQWVLGGMSAKQLRANSMEDVIFDGGQSGKPALFAEATLVFDNTDRELDIDMDEVSITRRLTRGKGTEYFINHQPAKLKELTTLFLNKGIGKNNYAITGQNRITEFVMMKPDEVRGVIEEAAGISGFRLKKNELEQSISNYDRDIESVNAVISEMSRNLAPLKKQIKNAEAYESIKKELDEHKKYYFSSQLSKYTKSFEEQTEKLNKIQSEINKMTLEKDEIDEYLTTYSDSLEEKTALLEELENNKIHLELKVSNLSKEKIMQENTLNNFLERKETLLSNIQTLEESSNTEEEEKNNLFKTIDSLGREIHSLEQDIENINKNIDTSKTELNNLESALSKAKDDITTYTVNIKTNIKDKEILENNLCELEDKIDVLNKELSLLSEEVINISSIKKENLHTIEIINYNLSEYNELDKKIKSLEQILNTSKKTDVRKNKALDTKKLLTNIRGFKDTLFNLISYDEKYATAIETLHGGILCNFVVEDSKSAEECVKILKKNKIPPANFIVLDKITTNKSKGMPIGNAVKVSDILTYEEQYISLILDYFSSSYITEDSSTAEQIWNVTKQKYRIATMDGTLYNTNVIRGGYIQQDIRAVKADYNKYLEKRQSLLTINEEIFSNTYELRGKINLLLQENKSLDKEIHTKNNLINSKKVSKHELESKINSLHEQLDKLTEELNNMNKEQCNASNLINNSDEMFAQHKSTIEQLSVEREHLLIDKNKKQTLLEEYEKQYYVYTNNSQEQIDSLKGDVDILTEQIQYTSDKVNQISTEYSESETMLNDITTQWNNLRKEIETSRVDKDIQSEKLNTLISSIAESNNLVTKINFDLEKIKETLNTCNDVLSTIPEDTEYIEVEDSMTNIHKHIISLEKKIKSLGFINTDAISEYKELNERYEAICNNKKDLEQSKGKIVSILNEMQEDMTSKYTICFNQLKEDFSCIFTKLFNGGKADLIIEDESKPLESGVIIKATPPGKKNKSISLLSGGEKSLAAVSFIFALLKYSPSPVVIFDEIDAALDEINVSLIADYIKENSNVQYVIVSHRKPMMKIAKSLYGASMNKGVTELLSQRL